MQTWVSVVPSSAAHKPLACHHGNASLFAVWLPGEPTEKLIFLCQLAASGSRRPSAADDDLLPRLREQPESALQQRAPQLQPRDGHLPESPAAAAGLQHGKLWLGFTWTHLSLSIRKLLRNRRFKRRSLICSCLLSGSQELEMLSEVSVASACVEEEVKQLQTQPRYWSHGEKLTLGKSELCHQTHISFLCPFVTSAAPQRISWKTSPGGSEFFSTNNKLCLLLTKLKMNKCK